MSRQQVRELLNEQYKKGVSNATEAARNIEKTVGVKVGAWKAQECYRAFKAAEAESGFSPPDAGAFDLT
jgi:hypothetical protein